MAIRVKETIKKVENDMVKTIATSNLVSLGHISFKIFRAFGVSKKLVLTINQISDFLSRFCYQVLELFHLLQNNKQSVFFVVFLTTLGSFLSMHINNFFFGFSLGLRDFFLQSHHFKYLYTYQSLYLQKKPLSYHNI